MALGRFRYENVYFVHKQQNIHKCIDSKQNTGSNFNFFFFFNYLSDKNTLDCNANMPIYTAFLTRCMPYALKDNAPTVPSNNLHTLSPLCRAKKI